MIDMHIVKVVIEGELPEECAKCKFASYVGNGMFDFSKDRYYCLSLSRRVNHYSPPDDCPLVKQKGGE